MRFWEPSFYSGIARMDVFAVLICCFVCTGSAEKHVRKQSLLSKVNRSVSSAASAARTYVSRPQAKAGYGKLARRLFNNENECSQSRASKLRCAVRSDQNGKSCSSSDDSLMTISLSSTPKYKYSDYLSTVDTAAFQESKSDVEQIEKIILCWKKGGTVPVRLRASILEECFGMVLLGR